MAQLAGLRESAGYVVRIRRSLEIRQVASNARRTGDVVVAKFRVVTIRALPGRHGVRSGQRKVHRGVIEGRRLPGGRGVAGLASLGEPARHVVRIGGALKIFQVAGNASSGGEIVVIVDVAVRAHPRRYGVGAGQRESRRVVIERRIQPAVGGMAGLAGGRKLAGHMARIAGPREIRRMAGIALGRHRLEPAGGRALVTGVAIHGRVCPGEREAIVMLLDLLDGDLPSANRVALLAIGSQLPLVNVGMAVLATLPHVGEHRLHVALDTGHRLVHAPQRVAGLIVIEFGNGANRLPRVGGMAVLAGNIQVAMGAVGSGGLRVRSQHPGNQEQKKQNKISYAPQAVP